MTSYQKLALTVLLETAQKEILQGHIEEAKAIVNESEKMHDYFEKKLDFSI